MASAGIVSNSSPLIFLSAVSDLHLLQRIFGVVTIPPAVWREVVIEGEGLPGAAEIRQAEGSWLFIDQVASHGRVVDIMQHQGLQIGESEAIALGEQRSSPVLLDEQRAVQYARSVGLRVVRTPLVYATAKEMGLIPSVRDKLDGLRSKRFFLKDRDYQEILRMVGEL